MWTQPDQDSHFQAGLNTLERVDYLPLAQSLPSQAEVREARAVLRKLKAKDAVAKRDNQRRQDRLESGEQLKIGKGRLRTTPISEAHAKTLENRRIIYNERVKPKKEKLAQQKQADWLRQVEHAQNIVARYEQCEAAARQEGMPPPSSYLQEMDFFPQQVMEHTPHSSSSWVAPSKQPTTLSPSELRPYSPQTFQFTLDGEHIEP